MRRLEFESESLDKLEGQALSRALEQYESCYPLSEIEGLVINSSLDPLIRQTAYLYLVANGSPAILERYSPYADASFRDSKGYTPTLVAIRKGNIRNLEWLLKDDDVVLRDKTNVTHDGQGPLLTATAFGQVDMLDRLGPTGYALFIHETDIHGRGLAWTAILQGGLATFRKVAKSPQDGGLGAPLAFKDNDGNNALLIAAAEGKQDIFQELEKPKSKGGFGFSIKEKNLRMQDVVLVSTEHNQAALFDLLTKSKRQGGYERPVKQTNKFGTGTVLTAVGAGAFKILDRLLKRKKKGGLGLSLDVVNDGDWGPIDIAVMNDHLPMLQKLIQDEKEGGYGIELDDIDASLELSAKAKSKSVYQWLFIRHLTHILASDALAAVTWAEALFANHQFCVAELTPSIVKLYKEALETLFARSELNEKDYSNAETLVNAIEELINGEGRMFIAGIYAERDELVSAFQTYQSVFSDVTCKKTQRDEAGFQLANYIYHGSVSVVEGNLDVKKSMKRGLISKENREKEAKDILVMQQRVTEASHYLVDNAYPLAEALGERFNVINKGQLTYSPLQAKTISFVSAGLDLMSPRRLFPAESVSATYSSPSPIKGS